MYRNQIKIFANEIQDNPNRMIISSRLTRFQLKRIHQTDATQIRIRRRRVYECRKLN